MGIKYRISETNKERRQAETVETPADPVLAMLGVGRHLWEAEPGDKFVERLRSEEAPVAPPVGQSSGQARNLADTVWQRVTKHQGDTFQTARGLPFTFQLEGSGIWFYRNG